MSRKVKFKFISIPINYRRIDGLLRSGAEFCDKPNEVPDSAVRVGLYYVLTGRNEYTEFMYTDTEKWIKVYTKDSLDLSVDFNGYHRLLTEKEVNALNGVKYNQLARYWRNLRYIQNLNNGLKDYCKRLSENAFRKTKRTYSGISLFHWTSLDRFY